MRHVHGHPRFNDWQKIKPIGWNVKVVAQTLETCSASRWRPVRSLCTATATVETRTHGTFSAGKHTTRPASASLLEEQSNSHRDERWRKRVVRSVLCCAARFGNGECGLGALWVAEFREAASWCQCWGIIRRLQAAVGGKQVILDEVQIWKTMSDMGRRCLMETVDWHTRTLWCVQFDQQSLGTRSKSYREQAPLCLDHHSLLT